MVLCLVKNELGFFMLVFIMDCRGLFNKCVDKWGMILYWLIYVGLSIVWVIIIVDVDLIWMVRLCVFCLLGWSFIGVLDFDWNSD